jgi:hypothetical protein
MDNNIGLFINILTVAVVLMIPIVLIIAISQKSLFVPPPRDRDFGTALADWAQKRGLPYAPQQIQVISGVYNNRWFSIGMTNEEMALRIRMRVRNAQRTQLQIFGDWLEDSGVITFVNRFRVYSSPSGLSETLFETGTRLRESLLKFPELRARLDLFSDSKDPNHLCYFLLADLPGAETLEKIMDSLSEFCDAFEQQTVQADP